MMKNLRIIILRQSLVFILLLVTFVESVGNNNTFFPRLPMGEFQMNIKRLSACDPNKHNKIQANWRLNKISPSKAVIDGNLTLEVPLDDSKFILLNIDQKTSNGRWTNNTLIFKKLKACSTIKSLIREEYYRSFGCPSNNPLCKCPFPEDVYYTKGFPAYNMEKVLKNLPGVFMYGTYRLRFKMMSENNEELMCFIWVFDLNRPWELP